MKERGSSPENTTAKKKKVQKLNQIMKDLQQQLEAEVLHDSESENEQIQDINLDPEGESPKQQLRKKKVPTFVSFMDEK